MATASLPEYAIQSAAPDGYLDYARFGPPTLPVLRETQAMLERASAATTGTVDELMRNDARARRAAARLLGLAPPLTRTPAATSATTTTATSPSAASDAPSNVVLLPNASTGLFHAAFGLPSGTVLVPAREFPSNRYPWQRTAALGRVRPAPLPPDPQGRVTPDLVRAALTPDTVALSVSAVDFRTGFRADLAALREVIGPDRLLIVDAIQGMGVVEAPWTAADIVVTGGQKWLRSGWSTGFLYASPLALERLEPVLTGWTGVADAGVFDDREHPAEPGAQRFSLTNLSPVAAGALAASLELSERIGWGRIAAQIAQRTAELIDTVRAGGGVVHSPTAARDRAGIVTFSLPGRDTAAVAATLAAHGLTATARTDHIRLSPHASTPLATADHLLTALTHTL